MQIIQHDLPGVGAEPGVQRLCVAGRGLGSSGFECWLLTLAPQAMTEGQQGDGEQVLIVLQGLGKLLLTGAPQRFAAPCTLVLPRRTEYRVVNQGTEALQLLAVRVPVPD